MMKYERLTEYDVEKWGEGLASVNGKTSIDKDITLAINRLAELEDKIEQGTLIKLPCRVGDTLYIVGKEIEEFIVSAIEVTILSCDTWETNTIQFMDKNGDIKFDYFVYFSWIGKTVFFTREEAEKKLKELQE